MAKDPFRLFARSIPKSWRYSIWATVLSQGGHQTLHLHPGGWLFGVYYVEVPETISSDENRGNEGWKNSERPDMRMSRYAIRRCSTYSRSPAG